MSQFSLHSKLQALALAAAVGAGTQAQATTQPYSNEALFLAAVPGLTMESFEALDGTLLGSAPVITPLLSLSVSVPGIAVQTGANTPQPGYDASASDGSHYVLVYGGAVAPGTLTITFAQPVTAFGFTSSDIGDSNPPAGALRLSTNTGTYATGVDVLSLTSSQPSGATQFIGLAQEQAFTQVQLSFGGFDDAYGIDEVYLATVAVPEPESWALMLAGGLALIALRRRSATQG